MMTFCTVVSSVPLMNGWVTDFDIASTIDDCFPQRKNTGRRQAVFIRKSNNAEIHRAPVLEPD